MPNRLASASSPYLLQHAHNPVDWHEWGPEAFALARDADKPVLLSIGYAACHWCHVMAHESFEDAATAELMNARFVNVKVDREQRPDIDRIYQLAHQLIQRRGGGWPLTAFLDPHTQQPFFVGTYFPKSPRHGMPAFREVLERVADWYRDNPKARAENSRALGEFFEGGGGKPRVRGQRAAPTSTAPTVLEQAQAALERDFDPRHGGFSPAPKFPHATQLQWLLRRDDARAQHMARFTLERMCRSGLFDHVGGGFYRYSVDERWEIPHFEKMLYDNGLMLAVLAGAGRQPLFERAARMTAGWVSREMQHADGGYFASLDADSEGEEGLYYLWDPALVHETLPADEAEAVVTAFGLDRPPNFEGRWHLHCADDSDLTRPEIARAVDRLFTRRAQRVRPGLDDKVLAGWNGLMIRGMALAGRAFDEPDWIDSAMRAAHFVRGEMWRDGRLCTSWRDGAVLKMAFLDDHAYLLDGLIELLQARFDAQLLDFAIALADDLLARYADEGGGFYFTAHDHERLIQRPKSFTDDATPNGNGVAALALGRLGHLLAQTRYLDAAAGTVEVAAAGFGEWPHAHAACLLALDEYAEPCAIEVYRSPAGAPRGTSGDQAPRLCFDVPADLTGLPGQLGRQPAIDGKPTRYRCVGTRCDAPEVLE